MGKEQSQSMDVLEKTQQEDISEKVKKRITERRILIIVHQSRQGITNLDACKTVQINGKFIDAHYIDGTKKILAVYDTAERAEDIFAEFLHYAFPELIENTNDLVWHSHFQNTQVYYLPEE